MLFLCFGVYCVKWPSFLGRAIFPSIYISFCRGTILSLNGFDKSEFVDEEEMEHVLSELILESEKEFNYKSEVKDHPNKKLRRWLYVHNKGLVHSEGSRKSETLESSADVDKKALHDLVPSSSSNVNVEIKAESPEIKELKDNLKVLKGNKKKMELCLSEALDMVASLNCLKPGSGDDFDQMCNGASGFLTDYRKFITMADRSSVTVEEAPMLLARSKALTGLMDAHHEGLKHNIKKYKPFTQ